MNKSPRNTQISNHVLDTYRATGRIGRGHQNQSLLECRPVQVRSFLPNCSMAYQATVSAPPGWPEGVPMPFAGQTSQKFFYSSDIDYPVKLKMYVGHFPLSRSFFCRLKWVNCRSTPVHAPTRSGNFEPVNRLLFVLFKPWAVL